MAESDVYTRQTVKPS